MQPSRRQVAAKSMCNTLISSHPNALVAVVIDRLQQTTRLAFELVPASALAEHLRATNISGLDLAAIESATIVPATTGQVIVVPLFTPSGQDIRLRSLISPDYLVANCAGPLPEIVCHLADAIVEAEQLKQEEKLAQQKLDHSLYQITTCFEELTWLRSVAEHFEICSLDDGLARAGQATLPPLRQLIFAQELYLFGLASPSATECMPPILAWDGEGLIPQPTVNELWRRLAGSGDNQLIVWNAPVSVRDDQDTITVRNCLLVPVMKSDELHGWLLAINKCIPPDDMLGDESAIHDQNLVEFGTSEAGLMSTMAVMLATHSKNVDLLREKEELLMGVLRALVSTIDAKDAYTGGHSDRVATYSQRIAVQLGLEAELCNEIYMSGLLHDIGKIGVPDALLGKPERLTDEEYTEIKRHPEIGYEILRALKPFAYLLPGVLHHHESFDGSGYPHGLSGEHIPLMGRIIAVADSYDAMTSNRTYRQGMPIEKAVQILTSGKGKQWDPAVVDAFVRCL